MDCLIIKSPHIENILSGKKKWELRGSQTHKTGKIGLIKSGSKTIVGECELVGCYGPLSEDEYDLNSHKHLSTKPFKEKTYKEIYAWILKNPITYKEPKPYNHPKGAIIWVKV